MGGRAGEHREEGWQWKTLGLCEAVGRLGVPFKISPGQWDERREWETKIKCHYDLSQVEQLLYDSLHLCLAYNKGCEAMYLSSMFTPSCLLCLIHDKNVSLHKHEALCVMCMPVLWPFVWHMKALCIYYPSRSFKVSSTHLQPPQRFLGITWRSKSQTLLLFSVSQTLLGGSQSVTQVA